MASSSNLENKATTVSEDSEQGSAASGPVVNNEVGVNSEKVSDGAETTLQVGTELHARTEDDVLKKLIRGPRYFNGYGENDVEDRPKRWHKQRHRRCYICGDDSHVGKHCKKVNPCFICSSRGHLAIDCPNKKVKVDCASTPCLKCGETGHDMFSCTDEYDPEDLKVIECYICKQVGHLCCVDKKAEGPREASCYNCGESGHCGLECTKPVDASNLQLVCRKCKVRGHSKKQCPKRKAKSANENGATKAERRKARNARRRMKTMQKVTGSASQPNCPPIVGPYHARPPTRAWWPPNPYTARPPIGGPYARLPTDNQPNRAWQPPNPYTARPPIGGPYARQPTDNQLNGAWRPPIVGTYYGRPGANVWLSPSAAAAARPNLSHQGGQHLYNNQVRAQAAVSFRPRAGFPYQHWRPQTGIQLPINQETGNMLPQRAMVPIPNWHYERRTKLLQPYVVNQQTRIQLPHMESGTLQTSTTFGSLWP